jgi:hypothetical protein
LITGGSSKLIFRTNSWTLPCYGLTCGTRTHT